MAIGTQLAAAAWAAMVLVTALPVAGVAQQVDKPARAVKPDQGVAVKVAKPRQPSTAQNSRKTETPGRQWVLEDALPDHSAAMRYYAPEPARSTPAMGRVPLRSGPGSFGIATDTQVKANQLPDGQTIPSLDTSSRRTPSYVGLSLTVPTSDKSLNIPVPFGAPW